MDKGSESLAVNKSGHPGAWRDDQGSDARSLMLLTVVLMVLIGSVAALATVLSDSAASDAMLSAVAAVMPDRPLVIPYFPSQYVNQATEIEPQPPTF